MDPVTLPKHEDPTNDVPAARTQALFVNAVADVVARVSPRLVASGYDVAVAADPTEGLHMARRAKPAAMVVGVSAGGEGLDVVRSVKADLALQPIPMIVLTAKERLGESFELEHVQDVIVEPFPHDALLKTLRKYLTVAKRILLIDDEADLTALIAARLGASGYEVVTANNGLEAVEKARVEQPDLVILDLMLPKIDGYQVCRLLKGDLACATIPIIMLTARQNEREGIACGADAYCTKPFKAEALLEKIQSLLGTPPQ